MSDNPLDGNCLNFKVPLDHKYEPSKDVLGLADISPKDKTWDKHRANADIVANYYAVGEKFYGDRYAQLCE